MKELSWYVSITASVLMEQVRYTTQILVSPLTVTITQDLVCHDSFFFYLTIRVFVIKMFDNSYIPSMLRRSHYSGILTSTGYTSTITFHFKG